MSRPSGCPCTSACSASATPTASSARKRPPWCGADSASSVRRWSRASASTSPAHASVPVAIDGVGEQALPRVCRAHRSRQGHARARRVVRSLQGRSSRSARARARRRSCERGRGASRCVPHRHRRRADPPGDRRGQPRRRAAVALRELLARAHGGMGVRQGGSRAGTQPGACRPRSSQRWRAAVSKRGGVRRSRRSARHATGSARPAWARPVADTSSTTISGQTCSGGTNRSSTGQYPHSRPPQHRGSRCPAP